MHAEQTIPVSELINSEIGSRDHLIPDHSPIGDAIERCTAPLGDEYGAHTCTPSTRS